MSHSPTRNFGVRAKPLNAAAGLAALRLVMSRLNNDLSPADNAANLLQTMLEDDENAAAGGLCLQTLNPMQKATLLYAAQVCRFKICLDALRAHIHTPHVLR